jgi:hypothetical protein
MSVSPSISQSFIPQKGVKGGILILTEANGKCTGPDRPSAQLNWRRGSGGTLIDAWKCDLCRLLSIPAAGLLAFVL